MRVVSRLFLCFALALAVAGAVVAAPPADDPLDEGIGGMCTIDFDSVCPDTTSVCKTKVRGGSGCVIDGLPFCYDSGTFSYRVNAGDRAEFMIRQPPVDEIEVYFAQAAAGVGGRMTFFDENGMQVGPPIGTNGICADLMPATQVVTFATPVARIRVRAIDTDVYVDSMTLTRN